jgi:ATP-dependent Zn protease
VVIKSNLTKLKDLKDALIEKETVEANDVIKILDGSHLPKEATLY